jgi:WD40 repeat protein
MNETSDDLLGDVLAAYLEAVDAGWAPGRQAFLDRYPTLRSELEAFFAAQDQVHTLSASIRSDTPSTTGVVAAAPSAPAPRSFGDYELLEEIARGGMGVVFKARQVSVNRIIALKMILAGDLASGSDVQRFRNEAEAAALMDHPNIVSVYDVGELGGWHYFSMKLVEGGSLAQLLGRGDWTLGTKDDCRRAARIIATVARAVHYAHQRGILHRDLKPANILLDEQHQPIVTDFGLAKRLDEGAALTQTGAIVGTPNYMAPEQAAGKHRELTTAADVYSLGAILYELLTGRPPFRAENVLDTLLQVREAKPMRPWALNPRVDADLETICLKCLEKEPHKRYASADSFADDLERWQRGEPVEARRSGMFERTWKWARRRPGAALMMGLIAVCLLLTAGYVTTAVTLRETEQERGRAEVARAEEVRLRLEAETAKESAGQQRVRAEFGLYVNLVMRAHFEWKDNAVERADQLLNECPEELRNWEWRYVKRLCHADLLTVGGDTSYVIGMSFSPDGKWLASTWGWDKAGVKVWDTATGEEVLTLKMPESEVRLVCFSADGKRLAMPFRGGMKVWDVTTGQESLIFKLHTGFVNSRCFSPDGNMCFSPDGKWLASAAFDKGGKGVKVWDTQTGLEALTLKGHNGQVKSMCFSPDSKRLAIAGNGLSVWDATTGQEERTLKGHRGSASSVCFSPDGKRLASASSWDQTVKVWDAATGQEERTLQGHTSGVSSVRFSPDGRRLATASLDKTVRVWDALTGQEERIIKGHTSAVWSVCFSADGKRLASATEKGTMKVWDATTGQEERTFKGHTFGVSGVCFSPDSRRLVCANGNINFSEKPGELQVWETETGNEMLSLKGHTGAVLGVCVSADGKHLASASADKTVKLWDAATGKEERTLLGHTNAVTSVCFSADGKQLASAGYGDGATVKVWDVATGQQALSLKGHSSIVHGVCFSPDGKLLASGSQDHTVKVWDAATGQEKLNLEDTGHVTGVCFSPDGKLLASASGDIYNRDKRGTVKVWDAATGQGVLTLQGHTGLVTSVCFSPDGKRIASGSADKTVKVWDAATGQEVITLTGHTEIVTGVCFSPDGRRLASGSFDTTVKIWDATPLPENQQEGRP